MGYQRSVAHRSSRRVSATQPKAHQPQPPPPIGRRQQPWSCRSSAFCPLRLFCGTFFESPARPVAEAARRSNPCHSSPALPPNASHHWDTCSLRLGDIDLYAWLITGAFLSCLINVDWWTPFACVGLCLWYLRYAGLRLTTAEAKLCATPSMHVVAGIGHTGKYVKTRKLIEQKQAQMARYHCELAHFRMFLDDPATTPPEKCRCVVGVSIEGNQEQQDFRSGRSTTRELIETIYGDQLHGDALILPTDLAKEQEAREKAAELKAEVEAKEATLTMAEKRKLARLAELKVQTFSDPGD